MPNGNKITTRSGREIWIEELNQELTYAGWLEGLPTAEWNKRHIDDLLETCRTSAGATPTQLLSPRETPIKVDVPYPFGTPAALPSVTCVAKFRSEALEGRDPLAYTELILVWLQDEFAMPIDETALNEIVELDWEKIAREFER